MYYIIDEKLINTNPIRMCDISIQINIEPCFSYIIAGHIKMFFKKGGAGLLTFVEKWFKIVADVGNR